MFGAGVGDGAGLDAEDAGGAEGGSSPDKAVRDAKSKALRSSKVYAGRFNSIDELPEQIPRGDYVLLVKDYDFMKREYMRLETRLEQMEKFDASKMEVLQNEFRELLK